jgi:hypothetical protein
MRYGRAFIYAFSGFFFYNFGYIDLLSTIAFAILFFGGLMMGLIAMQPGNPLDYRGF